MNRYDVRYGGPSNTKEKCRKCGIDWVRWRAGSSELRYKDCPKCESKEFAKSLGILKSEEE